LIHNLKKYWHEAFDNWILLEISTWKTCEIEIAVTVHNIQIEFFGNSIV